MVAGSRSASGRVLSSFVSFLCLGWFFCCWSMKCGIEEGSGEVGEGGGG